MWFVKLNSIISQVWGMPVSILIPKIMRKCEKIARETIEEAKASILGSNISDDAFCKLLNLDQNERHNWINKFRKNLIEQSLFSSSEDCAFSDAEVGLFLEKSDLTLKHTFDLLGSDQVIVDYLFSAKGLEGNRYYMALGQNAMLKQKERISRHFPEVIEYNPIDWHVDFKSGYRWSEKTWFSRLHFGQPGVDIKVPWELSRFQHVILLGQAYRISGDEKYAEEIIYQIVDWIEANPVGYGPNWAYAMDIAIRASNWLVSLSFIPESRLLTDNILWLIAKSIYQHGKHIRNHLEWSPQLTSNHYTSDITGLFFIANICPSLPEADEWASFSRNELEKEMLKQVYEDGCDFEASTCYHRLVLELFFYPALLAKKTGKPFSVEYLSRLESMFDALRLLLHGNGEMPQIGDNDSGRFLIFERPGTSILRMDYLLPIGDWFFGNEDQSYPKDVDDSPLYMLSGRRIPHVNYEKWESRSSHCFADAGWVVLRRNGFQSVVSCGPNGQNGNGGHAHNDKLSMEVSVHGIPVIVDPGTYLYTPDIGSRNRFRSTCYHSTPQLNGIEQNPISNGLKGAFTLGDNAKATIRKFDDHMLEAIHEGFGTPLRMSLKIHENSLIANYCADYGDYTMRWLLHPDVHPSITEKGIQLDVGGFSMLLCSDNNNFDIMGYDYSPAYGVIVPAQQIVHHFVSSLNWHISVIQT